MTTVGHVLTSLSASFALAFTAMALLTAVYSLPLWTWFLAGFLSNHVVGWRVFTFLETRSAS